MKKFKILSVLCALVFVCTFCAFSVFAAMGDAVGRAVSDDSAVTTENGNSIGTNETSSVGDTASTDAADTVPSDSGSTLGDTDGDGAIEGTNDTEMGLDELMPDENISENDNGNIESGDTAESAPLESIADDITDGEGVAEKTSSWLGIIITLVIVIALVCLIVAFIPRKRS